MKNVLLSFVFVFFLANIAHTAETSVVLPKPQREGGMPLQEALNKRHSHRVFSDKSLDNQMVSNILWSAFGINREDGKRTLPTASNTKNLSLYVILPNGVYAYDAIKNELNLIVEGDHRSNAGRQTEILGKAGLIVVYVQKLGDNYSMFNVGAAAQNVGLYSASANLGNVVVGSANIKELKELLKLPKEMQVQVIQAVGHRG